MKMNKDQTIDVIYHAIKSYKSQLTANRRKKLLESEKNKMKIDLIEHIEDILLDFRDSEKEKKGELK